MFEKKYTMEEFKEMYEEAVVKTIEELDKDFKEASNGDSMQMVAFSLQNLMVIATLKKNIFFKDGVNEK